MSWQMPPMGPWNPGMSMAPDMNMGSYTPDQWNAMQQQNWQQWAQWQQQYAQWQNQFGDKYAQQMQGMPNMGMMATVPPNVGPPPAPPPPDHQQPPPPPPPLPPPHENNQPLYNKPKSQPTPVPPPAYNQNSDQSQQNNPSSKQNWSYGTSNSKEPLSSVNAEALQKLAEEEKLFDIQFKKWEEEIDKWRKENVNHPDKQAYKDYEQKFESCRAQLLERRQQMKQRRDRLLGNNTQESSSPAPKTVPTIGAPVLQNNKQNNSRPNMQSQIPVNKPPPNFPNYSTKQNDNIQEYSNMPNMQFNRNNVKELPHHQEADPPHERYNLYSNKDNEVKNYSLDNNPVSSQVPKSNFLQSNTERYTGKDIPGLDLVPEQDISQSNTSPEVIDITDEQNSNVRHQPKGPDYSTISQGIHNILGDEKIMNMLNVMTRANNTQNTGTPQNAMHGDLHGSKPQYNTPNNRQPPFDSPSSRQPPFEPPTNRKPPFQNTNPLLETPNNRQQMFDRSINRPPPFEPPHNRQPPFEHLNNRPPPFESSNNRQPSFESPNDRQPPFERQNNQHLPFDRLNNRQQQFAPSNNRQTQFGASHNFPPNNQGMNRNQNNSNDNQQHDNQNDIFNNRQELNYPMQQGRNANRYPPQDQIYEDGQDQGSEHYHENKGNSQYGGSKIKPLLDILISRPTNQMESVRQNAPVGRPPLQEKPTQQNFEDFRRGPYDTNMMQENMHPVVTPPVKHQWIEEPLFTPSIIVEYEHIPLRLKAREFIEPVHMFDYNHISKENEEQPRDFEREADELFTKRPRRPEKDHDSYDRERSRSDRGGDSRYFERRGHRDDFRDDRLRMPPRDDFDRRRPDDRFDDRRRDDRDRYSRRDDPFRERDRERERERDREREKERDRDRERDRNRSRENRKDDHRNRSISRDNESRKREHSKENDVNLIASKKPKEVEKPPKAPVQLLMIDDLLEPPGREIRPPKIVIILRGPPGSGKSYLAKLIRDREAEHGGAARIMSIDDYFMHEGEVEEEDPATGKMIKKPTLKYEYDFACETTYQNSLKRAFKRSLTDGYFSFLIYDAPNETLRDYADIWNLSRQCGFQVYVCTLELDAQICFKRNIHNRTLEDIQAAVSRFFETPPHHIHLDPTTLLQSAAITDVQMEDVSDEVIPEDDYQEHEVESVFTSKWEKMDDAATLARLDGTSKPLRPSQLSMEDYLQLDDWQPNKVVPGKKTVRWADIEERREQEKMRAIGFVVGQTDWNRMTDPTMGSSALTQTKYIERVKRFR